MYCLTRSGVQVGDDNRPALRGHSVKQFGEFQRQTHTAVRIRITRQVTCMHGDPRPGQPLHPRHLRSFVDCRHVIFFLLENIEDSCRRGMSGSAGAHGGARDADAVAIHIRHLFRYTHDDQHRTGWRAFRFPDKIAYLQFLCCRWHPFALGESFGQGAERK